MVALMRRVAPLLLAALVLASPAVGQSFRAAYGDGLEAMDRRDWDAAVAAFRTAVDDRPEESERLPRLFFRRYTPWYYLALALSEKGDCQGAMAAFSESERQGVIASFPDDVVALRRFGDRCGEREAVAEARKAALSVIERAADSSGVVAELAKLPELATVWEWRENSLADRRAGADGLLGDARSLLTEGGAEPQLETLEEARRLAYQSYWQLEAIRAEASQHLGEIQAMVERKLDNLEATVEEARSVLRRTTALAPYPPGLRSRRDRLQGLLNRAIDAGEGVPPGELESLEADLEQAIQALESAATPPPRALREAAEAFFAGEYARTLELLDGPRWRGSLTLAHAALLRAAARWSLWRRAPDPDPELLVAARADVAECAERVPGLEPLEAWYPPAFRAFFDEVSQAGVADPGAPGT